MKYIPSFLSVEYSFQDSTIPKFMDARSLM